MSAASMNLPARPPFRLDWSLAIALALSFATMIGVAIAAWRLIHG